MELTYEILFRVNVRHKFYENGICQALYFEPTSDCRKLLRAYRLQFKNTINGFVIIAEKKLQVPVVPIDLNTSFSFKIFLIRNDFLNITDAELDKLSNSRKFFFRNSISDQPVINVDGSITSFTIHNNLPLTKSLEISNALFSVPVKISENPLKLVLKDAEDNLVLEKIIPRNKDNEIISTSLLLSKTPFEENIYQLQQINELGSAPTDFHFLTEENSDSKVAGIVQLNYNSIISSSTSNEFHFDINLSNRKIKWVYRIQVEGQEDITHNIRPIDLHLNDTITTLGTLFDRVDLAPPLPQGTIAIILFQSQSAIEMKQEPYKGIKLMSGTSLIPLLPNLPNPERLCLINGEFKAEAAIKIK